MHTSALSRFCNARHRPPLTRSPASPHPHHLCRLVFYTWSIRLLADSIGLFGSAEKLAWLANHTPQEAGRLAAPTLPGDDDKAQKSGCCGRDPNTTVGKSLPKYDVSELAVWWEGLRREERGVDGVCLPWP